MRRAGATAPPSAGAETGAPDPIPALLATALRAIADVLAVHRHGGKRSEDSADVMLVVTVGRGMISVGDRFTITFQRTLRIPDDGRVYPLPPGLGMFPLVPSTELPDHALAELASPTDVQADDRSDIRANSKVASPSTAVIPMYQREALWLGFDAAPWKPNAVKVAVGQINALTGEPYGHALQSEPQDYVVCPPQLWLDGVNASHGVIRQFVAMPLGQGYTIEAGLAGDERFGGIQITIYEPKPGRFPEQPPPAGPPRPARAARSAAATPSPMGLGAGGTMRQKIYPDPYGLDTWDQGTYGSIVVHILNSEQFRALTGHEPPPTPVSAKAYTEHGLPWFDLYDEAEGYVAPPDRLRDVKTVSERDRERGEVTAEESVTVKDTQVIRLDPRRLGRSDSRRTSRDRRQPSLGRHQPAGDQREPSGKPPSGKPPSGKPTSRKPKEPAGDRPVLPPDRSGPPSTLGKQSRESQSPSRDLRKPSPDLEEPPRKREKPSRDVEKPSRDRRGPSSRG